ncbi:unnamed protein product [Effrenium voratum]|nr:unnamed protein product [Effrenium voratum]
MDNCCVLFSSRNSALASLSPTKRTPSSRATISDGSYFQLCQYSSDRQTSCSEFCMDFGTTLITLALIGDLNWWFGDLNQQFLFTPLGSYPLTSKPANHRLGVS